VAQHGAEVGAMRGATHGEPSMMQKTPGEIAGAVHGAQHGVIKAVRFRLLLQVLAAAGLTLLTTVMDTTSNASRKMIETF
jgi:hypothetical protein